MERFISYLQGNSLSPVTIDRYSREVRGFMAWYGSEDLINCTKGEILNYLSYLKGKNQQAVTRNHSLIALRHYFDSLISEGAIVGNPTALIKLRGVKKQKLYRTYTPEEMEELADTYYQLEVKRTRDRLQELTTKAGEHLCKRSYLSKTRNYVMLQFFIHQGLRTREVLDLRVDDVMLHKATVHIQGGTRGKSRTLSLHATQMGSFMQYLNEIRPQLETPHTNDTLFLPIPKNDPRAKKETEANFKGFIKRLKQLDRNFESLAQLRSSVIAYWIESHGLRKAQYMAGHKSITSTENYQPNNIGELADDISKFNPF